MSTLKVESLRHYDADSDALTLSSSGTITFNGTLIGAADSAQVQSQIDSAAVALTGNQTIAGTKTFSSTPKSSNGFEAATAYRFTKSTISGTDNALYYDSDNLYVGRDAKDLRFRTNGGTVALGIDSAGSIYTGSSTGLGDKLSLYDNRLNGTNMYGFGIGGSTLYYRSFGNHDFVVNDLWDGSPANHKVRIDADGIKFHGDTAAANALDDYEEGTFTPTFEPSGGSWASIAYSTQTGHYTKIGNLVSVGLRISVSSLSQGTASGYLTVRNLPFTSNGSAYSAPTIGYSSQFSTNYPSGGDISRGTTYCYLYTVDASNTSVSVVPSNLTGTSHLYMSLLYYAA